MLGLLERLLNWIVALMVFLKQDCTYELHVNERVIIIKAIAVLSAIVSIGIVAPAVAAPVTMTFQNVSTTTTMTVSNVNTCGVLAPAPVTVAFGKTSVASSIDCESVASAAHVTYVMGPKTCAFHISTIYTSPNPITGALGYWTPNVSTTQGGDATCKVVSTDVSNIFVTGAFEAVFSMK